MSQTATAVLRHELLQDTADSTKEVAIEHGIDHDLAEQIGYAIADMLAKKWGGQTLSFPKDLAFELSKRDLMIFNDWSKGRAVPLLARDYKLAIQRIYTIIKRAKQTMIDERQRTLDLDDDK